MYRIIAALIVTLSLAAPAGADIYKWVDEDGNVTYSDEPRDGAERIEREKDRPFTEFRTPERSSSRERSRREARQEEEAGASAGYERVAIARPEEQGTVRDNRGLVDVQADIQPGLRDGHRLVFILDGEPYGEPTDSRSIQMEGVHRGEHSVSVRVVDGSGNTVTSSDAVTFYMQQASALGPANRGGGGPPVGGAPTPPGNR